jgi:hypothetical protein
MHFEEKPKQEAHDSIAMSVAFITKNEYEQIFIKLT